MHSLAILSIKLTIELFWTYGISKVKPIPKDILECNKWYRYFFFHSKYLGKGKEKLVIEIYSEQIVHRDQVAQIGSIKGKRGH